MRKAKGIAGATLLYGSNDPAPDLVSAMQFLVDDLRAEGRRVSGLRLNARSLRLRADEFELALTLANGPLPPRAQESVVRPSLLVSQVPDISRARLSHSLRTHRYALGFFLRKRGALPSDLEALAMTLAQNGRLYLLPVFEAAPPCLVIWQPGGMLFTPSEFIGAPTAAFFQPPDPDGLRLLVPAARGYAQRPTSNNRPVRPALTNREERAGTRSGGRLFSTSTPTRPRVLPRIEAADERLTTALRKADTKPTRSWSRISRAAVAALWAMLVPQLLGPWLLL